MTNWYARAEEIAAVLALTSDRQVAYLGDLLQMAFVEGKICGLETASEVFHDGIKEVTGQ